MVKPHDPPRTMEILESILHSGSLTTIRRKAAQLSICIALAGVFILPASVIAQEAITLPDAKVHTRYDIKLSLKGDARTYTWRTTGAGAFPDWLTLESGGRLRGIPTKAQSNATFEIATYDGSGKNLLFTKNYSIKVIDPISIEITVNEEVNPARIYRAVAANGSSAQDQTTQLNGRSDRQKTSEKGNDDNDYIVTTSSNSDGLTIGVRNDLLPSDEIDVGGARTRVDSILDFKTGQFHQEEMSHSINPNATKLINGLVGSKQPLKPNDYCVVHIVKWKPSQTAEGKFESDNRWHLFRAIGENNALPDWQEQTVQNGERIYGQRRVAALLIHLDAINTWEINYKVKIAEKIPTPIQNLLELFSLLGPGGARGPVAVASSQQTHLWGGHLLTDISLPSDVNFSGLATLMNNNGRHTQPPVEYPKKYDNEGRYHWDVSVGFPFTKLRQLEYSLNESETDENKKNIVKTRTTERQNAYAFLNLFFNPQGVDLKQGGFLSTPHLVLGLPFTGKPLDRPVVGLGMGIYKPWLKVNFFAGAVFNRVLEPETLKEGDATTNSTLEADLRSRRITKLIFGVNFPLSQARAFFKK